MSVYRPKDRNGKEAEVYKFDFQHGGRRFSGSTGATSEREALRVEKAERAKAEKETRLREQAKGALWTWEQAAQSYLVEVLGNEPDSSEMSWGVWLDENVGPATPIRDIDTAFIQRLVLHKLATSKGNQGGKVLNSTLNRTVSQPIRRILKHANKVHEQPIGKIDWASVMRRESKIRIRELRGDEEERLFEHIREDWRPFFRFLMISGLRLHEGVKLRWSDIDFENKQIYVFGKGAKPATVPLPPSLRAILEPLRGNHPEFVFTYQGSRTVASHGSNKRAVVKGQHYPLNLKGTKRMFAYFRDRAGLSDFRLHDLRHTALSRIVRATKNLQAAQRIGRHEKITTTMRYAHILDEDVFAAMEAGAQLSTHTPVVGPVTEGPTKSPTTAKQGRKKQASAAA